jgi:ketosteroid isomerase-like protein
MPAHAATGIEWLKAWHSQTVSPTFHGLGPMIAEGDSVAEEWETFIHGADGALYNNQYCWILRVRDDRVVEVREYEDSHHVWTILGRNPVWPELEPPTQPRASNLDGVEIVTEFDLAPKLLCDPTPAPGDRPSGGAGPEANTELIRSLHRSQAAGDQAGVNGHYAHGFQHFLAGERPFGWDHLPIEEIYAPLLEHARSPLRLRFGPTVAEGNRVFEEMESYAELDDGTVYHNWHCLIHEISDGHITQTREYLDTHHVWVVLGRWATWAAEPVPPLRRARRSNLPAVVATFQHRNPFLDLDRWGGALV